MRKQITNSGQSIRINVRVTPGAKRNSVSALKEETWHIKIAAPPVEGKANEELLSYLSHLLYVRKSSIELLKGQSSRVKIVAVNGLPEDEVNRRLASNLKQGT
jgi:uncharacterized protein (TIGR00251 family)